MANGFIDSDEEWLARQGGDGSAEGSFAMADGYNRLANDEVEAYNSRPAPDDWDGELRHQEAQDRVQAEQRRNAALAQQINANRGVYDGYAQMGNTVAARQAQYVNNANAHLASALRLAAENNGRLPQYAWQGLGTALGLDGKSGAIMGGGYDKKGGFTIVFARQNPQTGQIVQAPMSFTPQEQYSLMLSAPGIFSRQEVDGMRGQLINNYGMHPDQVPEVPQGWGATGNVGIGNRTAGGGTSVNPNWLYGPQRRSSISAFGSDGRGGFTQYESNEGTGWQLQSRDFGTRERTWDGMSERERIARINADSREKQAQTNADARIAAAEARGTGRAAGERVPRGTSAAGGQAKFNKDEYAALKEARDAILYTENEDGERIKRELSEDEKKRVARLNARMDGLLNIAEGEQENDRGGANREIPPQQRLVYYRDAQGNLKSGNGYVQGGRVYGADGNLIEGAREVDAKGRVQPTPEQARKLLAERNKAKAADKSGGKGKTVAGTESKAKAGGAGEQKPDDGAGWRDAELSPYMPQLAKDAMQKLAGSEPAEREPATDSKAKERERRRENAEAVREDRFQQFYKKFAIETEDGTITHTISEDEARRRFEREEEELRKKREEQAKNRRMAAELYKNIK